MQPRFNAEILFFMQAALSKPRVTREAIVCALLEDERVARSAASAGLQKFALLAALHENERSEIGRAYKAAADRVRGQLPATRPPAEVTQPQTITDAAYELLGLYVNPAYDKAVREKRTSPELTQMCDAIDAFVPLPTYAANVFTVIAEAVPAHASALRSVADQLRNHPSP